MKESTITAKFPCDINIVWDIITDNRNFGWRSDLFKVEVIDEDCFDEYTADGFVTHFHIVAKELYRKYQFEMENENMNGYWSGIFKRCDNGTKITFTEKIQVKKPIMNLFVKRYLKRQQTRYIADLKAAIEQQLDNINTKEDIINENEQSQDVEGRNNESRKGLSVKKFLSISLFIMVFFAIVSFTIMFYVAIKDFKEYWRYVFCILCLGVIFATAICTMIYFVMQVIAADINNGGDC